MKKERPKNSNARNLSEKMIPSVLPMTLAVVGSWRAEDRSQMAVDWVLSKS